MARTRDLQRPPAGTFLRELRRLARRADYPVVGQAQIQLWFHRHGYKKRDGSVLSWAVILDMQRRVGEPFGWHTPGVGRYRGQPISTHLLLLHWCMCHGEAFGGRSEHWRPAPRTARAQRAADRAGSTDSSDSAH